MGLVRSRPSYNLAGSLLKRRSAEVAPAVPMDSGEHLVEMTAPGRGGQVESNGGRAGAGDATMPGGGASYSAPLGTIGVGGAQDLGAAPANADCDVSGLGAMLRHRYSFDEFGTNSLDSIGTAVGTIIGTRLLGRGVIELTGANYANFPDGILSRLTNATIETWVVWRGECRPRMEIVVQLVGRLAELG